MKLGVRLDIVLGVRVGMILGFGKGCGVCDNVHSVGIDNGVRIGVNR